MNSENIAYKEEFEKPFQPKLARKEKRKKARQAKCKSRSKKYGFK